MTQDPDPNEALAAIRAARESVESRVSSSGWRYDLAYAAVVSAMVGSQALAPPLGVLGTALGVLALGLMLRAETRRTGVLLLGVTPRRARWVAFGLGGVMLVAMLSLVYVRFERPDLPLLAITAAVMALAFVVALGGSRLWRRVFRAEMRGES